MPAQPYRSYENASADVGGWRHTPDFLVLPNMGAVIGPALAGLLLPIAGAGWCFLTNSLSYLIVVAWLVRGPEGLPAPASSEAPNIGTVLAGPGQHSENNSGTLTVASYLRHSPGALLMLGLVAALSLLGRSYVHILPALVNTNWGGGVTAYESLAAGPGVGAVAAAGLTSWLLGRQQGEQRHAPGAWPRSNGWPVYGGAMLLGCSMIALGLSPVLLAAGAVLVVVGFASTGTMTLLNAALQISTPNQVRGRGLSVYTILAAGMPALGGWLLGTLLRATPAPVALVTAGLTLVLVTGVSSCRGLGPQQEVARGPD